MVKSVRILMLHNRYLQRGGEDTSFQMEVDMLRRRGCTVITHEENNERIRELGVVRTALRASWSLESYRKIRELLRDERCDILHVQNFFPLFTPSVYYAGHAEGVPVVQTLRNYRLMCPVGTFNRDGRVCEDCRNKLFPWPGVIHRCYRGSATATMAVGAMTTLNRAIGTWHEKVDAYIVLTNFMRQKFIAGGFPAEKLHVKPNFLDPDPLPGSGDGEYALYAGRLSEEKGISTLLKAWEKVGDQLPLKIAGEGPLEPMVREAAARMPLIEYLGMQSSSEVIRLMGEAAMFIMPTEFYEGHPRAAIEAFARQVPIVSSEIGAMAEIVEDKKSGLLFSPGNAEQMADNVRWAMNHRSELRQMGIRGRRLFEENYAADQNFPALMRIYERAIENYKLSCNGREARAEV